MNDIELLLQPEKNALLADQGNKLSVLARIQVAERPLSGINPVPMNLALVIDRSGSMAGLPLAEAKKCAIDIVGKMRSIDQVSVVVFDDTVDVIWPAQPVNNAEAIIAIITDVTAGGCTNLHGGWLAGAEQLARIHREGTLSRVMLLSDGLANRGETNLDRIAEQCRKMADVGITTSTYGLGQHFKEEFLNTMAETGLGNSYYGELATDLQTAYEEEFSLLQYTCAKNVQLSIKPADGVSVKMKNPYRELSRDCWQLPNLAWGAETWALLEVEAPKNVLASGIDALTSLLAAKASFETLEKSTIEVISAQLQLPSLDAAAYEAIMVNETVSQRIRELEVADITLKARALALRGNWEGVEELVLKAERTAGDHEWLLETTKSLLELAKRRNEQQFSKEAYFSSNTLSTRHALAEEHNLYEISIEHSKAAFLRRKPSAGKRF